MTYVRNVKEISTDRNDRKIYIEREKSSQYNMNCNRSGQRLIERHRKTAGGGNFLGRGTHEVAYYVMSKGKNRKKNGKAEKREQEKVLTCFELGALVYNSN